MLESIEIFERMAVLSVTLSCLSFKPPFYRDLVMLGQRPTCTGPAGSLQGPTDGGAAREPERDQGGTFHFMLYRFPSSLTPLLQDRDPAATRFYVFLYTCRPTLIMSPCPPGKYSRQLVGTLLRPLALWVPPSRLRATLALTQTKLCKGPPPSFSR